VIEKELSCGVNGETEEEFLEIDRLAIAWDLLKHKLEVAFESVNIGNLITRKVGT
jgi:hypothetical protein